MQTHTLEIKVALLGHVSAGKSTVLNALLRDKFSEVSMRRTTAGVNYFRLHTKVKLPSTSTDDKDKAEDIKEGGTTESEVSSIVKNDQTAANTTNECLRVYETWGSEPDTVHDAAYTLQKITQDNAILRQSNKIQESTFDIELDEPLCEMRKDTKLVLIDIPGLNEAGSKDMYREYVNNKWDTFDCVIAVMDVTQGVNTEEQVDLLRLIQHNIRVKKDVAVIVLCNKVDDPENQEIKLLVDEVRNKVREIFVSSSAKTKGSAVVANQSAPKPPPMTTWTSTTAATQTPPPMFAFGSTAMGGGGSSCAPSPAPLASGFRFGASAPVTASTSTGPAQSPGCVWAPAGNTSTPASALTPTPTTGFSIGVSTSTKFCFDSAVAGSGAGQAASVPPPIPGQANGKSACFGSVEFIPVSAENAFVYRTASKLDLDGFKKLDKDLVERLGRDEVGKSKWRSLSQDEKYLAAYEAIHHNRYEESFDDTNFDQFLSSFKRCVGGDAVQLALLDKQIAVILKSLNFDNIIATELRKLSVMKKALSRKTRPYQTYFWDAYSRGLKPCVDAFKSDMDHSRLHLAMSQLIAYATFVEERNGSKNERHKILDNMISLVRLQIGLVLKKAEEQRESPSLYKELFDWDRDLKC